MARPQKLAPEAVQSWLSQHPGWENVEALGLTRAFKFKDFAEALAFVVRISMAAEKRDHHPHLELDWGLARASWITHDAGGLTPLDLEMADLTARLFDERRS